MFKTYAAALLAVVLVSPSLSAHGQAAHPAKAKETGDAQAGQDTFMQRCFQCHSVTEGEVRVGPSLYHVTKPPHPRKTPAGIREILANGKNKMPSFKEILTKEDTDNLIAYLKSL